MLTDSKSPKLYRLLNMTTDRVPGLLHASCDLGLERLKRLLAEDNHKSFGTYIRCGSATSTQCMDGELTKPQRSRLLRMIDETADAYDCNGYYFIHSGDEQDTEIQSHYYISL